jgi:hypothetical protein
MLKRDQDLRTQIQSGDIAFDNQRSFARLRQLGRDAYPLARNQIRNLFGWDT